MNYGEIQTEVAGNVIDTPPFVQSNIPFYINRAIRKLERRHNFYIMRALTPVFVTTEGVSTLGAVPADFKDWRARPYMVEFLGRVLPLATAVDPVEPQIAFGISVDTDQRMPYVVYRDNTSGTDTFYVAPLPDGNSDWSDGEYRIYVPYWKYLPDLAAEADTNWFTENAEEWVMYRATALAFEADHDLVNAQYWQKKADGEFAEIISFDKRLQFQGTDTLVPHQGMYEARIVV